MAELKLPKLGATMTEGTIIQWHVKPGDAVNPGNVLYEVSTDKVTLEVEADTSGTIQSLVVAEGQSVRVGSTVALIVSTDESQEVPIGAANPNESALPGSDLWSSTVDSETDKNSSGLRASPAARRRARELGVDLATVEPTGPRGRIQREDVDRAAKRATRFSLNSDPDRDSNISKNQSIEWHPFLGLRHVMAARMTESAIIPQVTLHCRVEIEQLMEVRRKIQSHSNNVSVVDLLLKAICAALAANPSLNAWVSADGSEWSKDIRLGYAVDTPQGLVVPVINGPNRLSIIELAEERRRLITAAQSQRLSPEEVNRPSFTVTNLGLYGVEWFNPLIYPPQAGILGIGQINTRGVDRLELPLSLTFDHRAIDGAEAGRFLTAVAERCENPWLLL